MKQAFFFLFFSALFPVLLSAQEPDSSIQVKDSLQQKDTLQRVMIPDPFFQTVPGQRTFLTGNKFFNNSQAPAVLQVKARAPQSKESLFYLLTGLVLVLAFFRYFFDRYFTNLFRVFFNSSLRQSQLTDQLLQAKLPSLLFNLFFMVSGGLYVYLLLHHYRWLNGQNGLLAAALCTGALGVIYVIKFCTLKFTGWLTGYTDTVNIYVFIVFLINKIIGIFLVPFIIIMAFSDIGIVKIAVISSLLFIGFLLILRFFRSYGILQNQLKVSKFHFLLYIAGVELLPLLLIYKGLMVLLNKNL